jgi:hypothetical protein
MLAERGAAVYVHPFCAGLDAADDRQVGYRALVGRAAALGADADSAGAGNYLQR